MRIFRCDVVFVGRDHDAWRLAYGYWLLAIGGEGSGVYKKPVVVAQRVGDDSSGRKMRLPSSVLTVAGSEGLLWRE